jgi:hypothetical protein
MATKPKVQDQGKVIAEWDAEGERWLVMYPDGRIESYKDKRTVERRAKRYFWIHNDPTKIGVGKIEWRTP